MSCEVLPANGERPAHLELPWELLVRWRRPCRKIYAALLARKRDQESILGGANEGEQDGGSEEKAEMLT